MGAHEWSDLAVAALELAIARLQLTRLTAGEMLDAAAPRLMGHSGDAAERVERVRVAIARISHRVPWRADCLVQALAARHWLARYGLQTSLSIGFPAASETFEAHAWSMCEGEVVTGGDVNGHVPLQPSGVREAD